MGKLTDKVAIVTGGGGGIGAASAHLFAREGAKVAVVDLRAEAAKLVAQEIKDAGGEVIALEADVAREDDVRSAVARTVETFGRLDVLLNNAGLAFQHRIVDAEVKDWDRVMSVNLRGTFLFTKHAAPAMRADGAIVNIASVAALMAVRDASAYSAAKAGVVALTRVAAAELGPDIRVNCICPGTVRTAMPEQMLRNRGGGDAAAGAALTAQKYLLGRLGEPEEIASTALFLAGPDSSFFTGAVLAADGGVTAQ